MDKRITLKDIQDNSTFFGYNYLCWTRAYDNEKELNIDEALEIINIDQKAFISWEKSFFPTPKNEDEASRYIFFTINDSLSFTIKFRQYEICYFLNDIYIGNLGGHFEAWFFTWKELLALGQSNEVFLLLLPMTGITKLERPSTLEMMAQKLSIIPKFDLHADYLTYCILNGLKMEQDFYYKDNIGIANRENHSVRNIEKYPRHKEDIILVNQLLTQIF